jgi:predicted nucleic acid-binding protein
MIVLDASAFVKLVVKEEGSMKANSEVSAAIIRGEIVAAPDIALAETLNSIWKNHKVLKNISKEETRQYTERTLDVWDKLVKIDTVKLAESAMNIAISNNITLYDSLYVAAAKTNNSALMTFDQELIKKADKLEITIL